MDIYLQISVWAFLPQTWLIIGLAFIVLEVTNGSAIFFLPLGVGALLVAVCIYLIGVGLLPQALLPASWYWLPVYWMPISVVVALLISRTKKYRRSESVGSDDDINKY